MMTLQEIFRVQESYKLPDTIMEVLMSKDAEKYIREVRDNKIDIRDTFQEEQGDRNRLKQDFTPDCLCWLVAHLMKDGNCLDTCSGTGVLSKEAAKVHGVEVEEWEFSERTIPFAILDACVNGLNGYISRGDCLRNEIHQMYRIVKISDISIPLERTPKREIGQYNNVIMNPPYSMKFPDAERYPMAGFMISKSKADYGFLLRGLQHLKEDGRLIAILPHGVLFRGAGEGKIREWLIKQHLINAVIGLPNKLFLNTSIPVCILIIERHSPNILFIDASQEYIKGSSKNDISGRQLGKIVDCFSARTDIERYSRKASYEEIEENDYNLNIPRYVDTFEEQELPDIGTMLDNLDQIETEERNTRSELYGILGELTGNVADIRHVKKHQSLMESGRHESTMQTDTRN